MHVTKPIRFEWDQYNLEHTAKHGVSPVEIEYVMNNDPAISPDPYPVNVEERWRAIGLNPEGRYVFIVFMFRASDEVLRIRPISARYMHGKEVESYAQR